VFFYPGTRRGCVDWAKNIFVRNARLYEMVLEGMWEKGEEDALAISGLLQERGVSRCTVLDVPCGIGRVGVPLAQLGFSVTGVDYSPHLVDVANIKARQFRVQERAAFRVGTMSGLDLGRSFDCAINVFTSVGYGSEEDDLDYFRSVRKAVRKGGLFIISGLRNRDYLVEHPAQNIYEESRDLLVLDRYSFDASRSRERGSWRFYLKVKQMMKFAGEFPVDIRVYSPQEVTSMLKGTGWSVPEVYESLSTKAAFTSRNPVYALVSEAV
jgi:SAM-dependent methyltransferase